MPDSPLRYERYGRYFAVYENGSLLCVAVYKKGALALIDRLSKEDPVPSKRSRVTEQLQNLPA